MKSTETTVFDRINNAEPFVAIRLVILQAGIALGLYWAGAPVGHIPKDLDLFPLNLMGIFDLKTVLEFGYPLREMVWSGEWWRLGLALFLPPGLGWFVFSLVAFLPLGKLVEEELGRRSALMLYLAGGVGCVLVDYVSAGVITAGSLGMVFAAGGFALCRLVADRWIGSSQSREASSHAHTLTVINTGTWMSLLLVWIFSLIQSYANLFYQPSIEHVSFAQVGPTQSGLTVALLTGLILSIPKLFFIRIPQTPTTFTLFHESVTAEEPPRATATHWFLQNQRWLVYAIPTAWWLILLGFSYQTWNKIGHVDYRLWKYDVALFGMNQALPEVTDAQQAVQTLMEQHPDDLLVAKRLAVSYAYSGDYENADQILDNLFKQVSSSWSSTTFQGEFLIRKFRLAALTRRDLLTVGPWRRSVFSSNYDVDPLRLLWDRAHLARLMGASQELELLSDKLIHSLDQIIPPREKPTEAANSSEKSPAQGDDPLLGHNPSSAKEKHETNRQHSIVLNHHAYVRAELGGDLARAIQEASLSVSLDPSADNLDTLGWAKIQAKLIPEGIHTLQKALLYNETRSAGTINYHLGYAFHQAGDQETARKHFENALRYDLDWWDEKVLVQVCPECLKNSAQ